MIKIEQSTVINRPIEEVFSYVTDIDNLPMWSGEIVESRKTSDGPTGEGTTFDLLVKALGRKIENTHEISAYEPNSKFGIKITSGPVLGEAEYSFEPVNGGSKVSVEVEAEAGGFFKLADPLVARTLQRQYEANLATLKDLLEAGA